MRTRTALVALVACLALVVGGLVFAQDVTLRVATTATDQAPMQALIDKYQEENPNVTINPTYADTDQFQVLMRTQLSSGTAPDVFFTWPGGGNSMALREIGPGGFLADLSDRPWAERVAASYASVIQLDGTTYILPMTTTLIGTIYNVGVFEENGVEVPTTWDELLAVCDVLDEAGVDPIALGNQTPWVTQLIPYAIVPSTVYADNPDFAEQHLAGETSFVDSGWRTAFEKYVELEDAGCFQDNPNATSFEQSLRSVASGEAAMVVQVSSVLNQVRSYNPDASFAMFPFPAVNDADEVWIPAAAGSSFGVNADSRNFEQALDFIDFLAAPENMAMFAEVGGFLPAVSIDEYELDPALEPMMAPLNEGKTAAFMDQLWPNARVQQVHFSAVQELFSDRITIDQVLEDMERAFDDE